MLRRPIKNTHWHSAHSKSIFALHGCFVFFVFVSSYRALWSVLCAFKSIPVISFFSRLPLTPMVVLLHYTVSLWHRGGETRDKGPVSLDDAGDVDRDNSFWNKNASPAGCMLCSQVPQPCHASGLGNLTIYCSLHIEAGDSSLRVLNN